MEKALRQSGVLSVRLLALVLLLLVPTSLSLTTSAFANDAEATILVMAPDAPASTEIIEGMAAELPEEFALKREFVSPQTSTGDVGNYIKNHKPNVVILLNNNTVRLYREYQAEAGGSLPPAIIAMTSFADFETRGLKNYAGIHYEIPALTGFRELNAVVKKKIKKIGVVYRSDFADIIEAQKAFLEPEGFELVSREVRKSGPPVNRQIHRALRDLAYHENVDAIWLLNDNALLSQELLVKSWFPALKYNRKPILVGVPSLIAKNLDFGTFAVLPDHEALGGQLAELVFEIEGMEWSAGDLGLIQPVSVKKILHVRLAKELLSLEEDKLEGIDELLK